MNLMLIDIQMDSLGFAPNFSHPHDFAPSLAGGPMRYTKKSTKKS